MDDAASTLWQNTHANGCKCRKASSASSAVHEGHAILLAYLDATDGSAESCVVWSDASVKGQNVKN